MQTIEQGVAEILSQSSYTVSIGDKAFKFRYASLEDLQNISALVSTLPKYNDIDQSEGMNAELPQLIDSFGHANTVAEIILLTIESDGEEDRARIEQVVRKVEKLSDSKFDFKKNHVFFYQNTITTLRGMNILKPTKETDLTVHGQ